MILGGRKDLFETLKSVELYNWRTGQQCQLGDLPSEIFAHSGTEIDGVPVFCGGIKDDEDQSDCYKYSSETDSWEKVSEINICTFNAIKFYVRCIIINLFLKIF
jgi:hypothetical protein